MDLIGNFSSCLAWLLSLLGIGFGIKAGISRNTAWFHTTRTCTILVGFTTLIALAALGYLFVINDYTNQYVWQYSNRDMPALYKLTAIWGGMDGSMLLWCAALTTCAAIVALQSTRYPRVLMPWVLAVLNSCSLFFLTVATYLTNPFRYLKAPFIPPDGNGLNPLLQNPYMAIHPPTLYLGFTFLAVPFSFCAGALLSGHLSNEWIRLTRRWTLIGWGFLTLGITLGGYWAYIELGWGGFWAWDPVENSSFLPWLTSTAFLHSVMVQERKNMLRLWSVWLIFISYMLTVFGTFLTRSGVVQSVHAFASTDIGWVFLLYLAVLFGFGVVLTAYRYNDLKSERRIESLFSREAAFLLNNLLFLSICFATIWGVLFPVFSEYMTGQKQAVGIPFFNAVNVPLFLLLILLMGIGPMIAWKRASVKALLRTFASPALVGVVAGGALMFGGITDFYPVTAYALCAFVGMTILHELYRGIRAQRAALPEGSLSQATGTLLRRHRIRYGGYLIHIGVLIATIGITASMAHKIEREVALQIGDSYSIGRFELTLDKVAERRGSNFNSLYATATLRDKNSAKVVSQLEPELRFYPRGGMRGMNSGEGENTTEVALFTSLREDFYLVLAGLDDSGNKAALKMFVNPLQMWLWIGVVIIAIGVVVVLPARAQKV